MFRAQIKTILSVFLIAAYAFSSVHAEPPMAKVSVLASGKLLLDGSPADLASIESEFKRLQRENGVVWYYRENAQAEPSSEATAVVQLVIKYNLPISMSSKPDFSDFIDETGRSRPRK